MSETTLRDFCKQPTEVYTITIDYASRLPGSATVASGTVGAINADTGASSSGTVLSGTVATTTTTTASIGVQAGTDGETHKITFTTTLSDSSILVDELLMRIIDL